MNEQKVEEQDSLKPEGTEDAVEPQNEGDSRDNNPDAKFKEIAENQRIRAEKAESELKKLKNLEQKAQNAKDDPSSSVENVSKTVHALKDYSPEEVDLIFRQAKVLGVDPIEATKNEDVALLLKAKRDKVEKENKTPEPTNRQVSEEKPFDNWTSQDMEGASVEQLQKFRDHLRKRSGK